MSDATLTNGAVSSSAPNPSAFFSVILASLCLGVCALGNHSAQAQQADDSVKSAKVEATAEANAALIKSAYDAFSRGNIPSAMAAFADDIFWHVPGRGPLSRDYRGRAEVLGFSATSWSFPTARSGCRSMTCWPRATGWSCSAPRVHSVAAAAGRHRRSTFGPY